MARVEQHSRGEGVQAAGFHLQQAVPPVCLGYTEIVHGTPKDPKGGVLQHKVLALGVQPRLPVSYPGRDQTAPVQPAESKGSREASKLTFSSDQRHGKRQASSPPSWALGISF